MQNKIVAFLWNVNPKPKSSKPIISLVLVIIEIDLFYMLILEKKILKNI